MSSYTVIHPSTSVSLAVQNQDNFRFNYPTGLRPVGPATMLRVKRKDVKMCNIGSGAAAAGTEDGFGEGQAVAGTIISKFSSQPVTAVDNEDDEDTVFPVLIICKRANRLPASFIIFLFLVDFLPQPR